MGNLVKTYPNFGPDFTITFDIKITEMPAGWHNVLHMMGHPHCCDEGSRIPGVWLNSSYGKPYILIDIVMKGQLQKFSKVLEMNKQYYVELVLASGIFTIRINGDQVWQVEAGIATYKNVKYYLSSPGIASAGNVAIMSMPKIQLG